MKFGFTDYLDNKLNENKDQRIDEQSNAKTYDASKMTFANLYKMLSDMNSQIVVDGETYTKHFRDNISGYGYSFVVTSKGVIRICTLESLDGKYRTLVYDIKSQRFMAITGN